MNILDSIQSHHKLLVQAANDSLELAPKAMRLQPTLDILRKFKDINVSISCGKITLSLHVTKMDEIIPFLDAIEEAMGISFDNTHDVAQYSWREFKCKDAPWIEVDAHVPSTGEDCRRVVVGYKQEPVYEIKCGDDAKVPDAPKPPESSISF